MNMTQVCSTAQLAINKKQKCFSLLDLQLTEIVILIFSFLKKGLKKHKTKFVTKSVENIITIVFM